MDLHYEPKNFAKEYVKLKGSSQYPMFAATALGIKPSYDDWVDVCRYDEFCRMCGTYGLHVEPDVVFLTPQEAKENVIGWRNITTTYACSESFTGKNKSGQVHVFVSKKKETALEAKKFGWYPVVTGGRSVNKPFVDHLRFGRLLGFPKCCVDFFRKYNNWSIYSHPYETFRNTKGKLSYYCNNFFMDRSFSLIHHLPCSYNCRATIEMAERLESELKKREPFFVSESRAVLKKPLLVFGEQNFAVFWGVAKGGKIRYSKTEYLSNRSRPEDIVPFAAELQKGKSVTLSGDSLYIGGKREARFPRARTWFIAGFE